MRIFRRRRRDIDRALDMIAVRAAADLEANMGDPNARRIYEAQMWDGRPETKPAWLSEDGDGT